MSIIKKAPGICIADFEAIVVFSRTNIELKNAQRNLELDGPILAPRSLFLVCFMKKMFSWIFGLDLGSGSGRLTSAYVI